MRLDVNDPKVFDKWRELYYDLSHEENIQFGRDMEAKYPGQASFDAIGISQCLQLIPAIGLKVVEVGGWKGELAQVMGARFPTKIASWHNIDMCKAAVDKSLAIDSIPYLAEFPDSFDWFTKARTADYDLFISAHSIEHLTDKHLLSLLDWLAGIPHVILEAPITNSGQTWEGYCGTHILEMGWTRVHEEMRARGYAVDKVTDILYKYRKVA